MVASSEHILDALNVMEDILLRPRQLAVTMSPCARWEVAAFLDVHFAKVDLRQKVRVFPDVMFSIRGETDATRGLQGVCVEDVGAYVKYHLEYHTARRYITLRRTGAAPELFQGLTITADGLAIAPKRLLAAMDWTVSLTTQPASCQGTPYKSLDATKLWRASGWQPKVAMPQGMTQVLAQHRPEDRR